MADANWPPDDPGDLLDDRNTELDDLDQRVGLLWREIRQGAASTRLSDYIYRENPDGLDLGQVRMLEACVAIGPCRVVDLATFMDVRPSTVSRALARLEADGYVTRRGVDDDKRAVMVEASPAGLARHRLYMRRAQFALTSILDGFTGDERQMMAEMFARLIANIDHFLADHAHQRVPDPPRPRR